VKVDHATAGMLNRSFFPILIVSVVVPLLIAAVFADMDFVWHGFAAFPCYRPNETNENKYIYCRYLWPPLEN